MAAAGGSAGEGGRVGGGEEGEEEEGEDSSAHRGELGHPVLQECQSLILGFGNSNFSIVIGSLIVLLVSYFSLVE